jgi:UDP-N-acetylmuramate dehydrogenase
MKQWKRLKGRLRFKEPLCRHASFKIGGEASIFFEPHDVRDLVNGLKLFKINRIPYFLVGNGTNLLISDKGFKGAVIKLSAPFFKNINIKNNIVRVGAGASIRSLIERLSQTNLGGYEFLAGIPATVGGALIMNAGVTIQGKRFSIADLVRSVKAVDRRGRILNLSAKKINFGYRKSDLGRYIILEAQIKLTKDEKAKVAKRISGYLSLRRQKQDYSRPNAGCIFKNPSGHLSAGMLIDRCGLKGRRYGGAIVSQKHANFILNFNRAKAGDVIKLMEIIKQRVKKSFDISLKEEIKIVS